MSSLALKNGPLLEQLEGIPKWEYSSVEWPLCSISRRMTPMLLEDEAIGLSGMTRSANFPVTDGEFNGGSSDNILCVFDSELSELEYSVAVGGSGEEKFGGIALHYEFLLIASSTRSTDLEISETGYDSTYNGGLDVYVIKLPVGALESSMQEREPSTSEPQPSTPPPSGDAIRIPWFPVYSLVIGLLIAIILISFKGKKFAR